MVGRLLLPSAEEGGSMPVAKITGQGLLAIALSVALLWGCLIDARFLVRRASQQRIQIFLQIEQLQRSLHPRPSISPFHSNRQHPMIAVG